MAVDDFFDPEDNWSTAEQRLQKSRQPNDPLVWKSANGRETPIRDLDDRHLLNIIAFVERSFRELQDAFCDDALDIDLLWPQHAGLVAEARRRRLIKKRPRGDRLVTA